MNGQARCGHRLTLLAAAVWAAFGPATAGAEEDERGLTRPSSEVSAGVGYVDVDNGRFGQYTGLNEQRLYLLLDGDVVLRDDATGHWIRLRARGLGLNSRELRFDQGVQGNWGYFLDYSRIPRYEPYTVNTAVAGIGTNTLTVPTTPTPGPVFEMKTERDRITAGFTKSLGRNWDLSVAFRNEDKDGARVWARGTTGGPGFGNFEFAPEPINSTTQQMEVTVDHTGQRLQLSGGYYGSIYRNQYNGLFISGGATGLSGGTTPFTPLALPPDNHAHQLHLSGGYAVTPATRVSFKLAYARAIQDDAFLTAAQIAPTPAVANLPANLDGRVDTTLAQVGVHARPFAALTLRATASYNDRDDRTRVFLYNNSATATSTFNGENEPRSIRTTNARVDADYALLRRLTLTGGVQLERKQRKASPVRIVSHRDRTDELTLRLAARGTLSDTLSASAEYLFSDRDGSAFAPTLLNGGGAGSNVIAPIYLADRQRNTARVTATWQPVDPLSMHLRVDVSDDEYVGDRDGSGLGPRQGEALNAAFDVGYAFTEKWSGSVWYGYNSLELDQASRTSGGQPWAVALRNSGTSAGLSVRGSVAGRVDVGADLSQADLDDRYRQQALAGAAIVSLPDVTTRQTRIALFGRYALGKSSGLRLDWIHDRFSTNDWTWTSWTYLDGTQLTEEPKQRVHFVGVSYYYRFVR
jgi:MtrB/PioB family decaheme-associated outer membrane protein